MRGRRRSGKVRRVMDEEEEEEEEEEGGIGGGRGGGGRGGGGGGGRGGGRGGGGGGGRVCILYSIHVYVPQNILEYAQFLVCVAQFQNAENTCES